VSVGVIERLKKSAHPTLQWISENGRTPRAAALLSALTSSAAVVGIKWSYIEGVLTVEGLTETAFIQLLVRAGAQYALQHWLYQIHKVSNGQQPPAV
jgi:hypothetical protein